MRSMNLPSTERVDPNGNRKVGLAMPKRPKDQQAKAIARVRRAFRDECHSRLDAYLNEPDEQTGLPMIDVLIAYAGQGWGVSVGVSLQEPEEPTEVEEQAEESGIEIVRA